MGKRYHTDGRQQLLRLLEQHTDRPLTVEEMVAALPPEAAPGKSTVYRLISELVAEGAVRRFVRRNSRQFVYQLFGGAECAHHLHLKCVDCGRVVHLDAASSEATARLLEANHFSPDRAATMLWGRCEGCAGKEKHA